MTRLAGIVLLCVIFNTALMAQTPVSINGALRVENNIIVNKNGLAPQLRGISLSWSIWKGMKYYDAAAIACLLNDFEVSFIRAPMAVQPAHGYLQGPAAQKQVIINTVD